MRFDTPYILDDHDDDDWSAVEDASSKIAIHEARDPEIAGALLTLKIESAKLRRNLLKIRGRLECRRTNFAGLATI